MAPAVICCAAAKPRHPDGEHVRPLMAATFREYGSPRVMLSDNGPPFAALAVHGLSSLAVGWIQNWGFVRSESNRGTRNRTAGMRGCTKP